MNILCRALLPLITVLYLSGCGGREIESRSPVPDNMDPVSEAIHKITKAKTRILWLQDTEEKNDYLARKTNLRLMGLDTYDERGERVILHSPHNIAKPMFTVDGNRIVFSNRHNGTMHIVDWEGGEVSDLGKGFVLHTWRDPRTHIEWLYYARDLVEDGKVLPTHEAIFRKALHPLPRNIQRVYYGLRGRLGEKRVWRQTHVSEDSYQLSADGRIASAPFPWPEVGVHDIEARRWNRHGRGCWVAMAPDNSYLFWILDGPHRNLIMERIGTPQTERWSVKINGLPNDEGYEVYHPRWSNDPRIMAVTGPYKVGEGAYRLPGGGPDVEVYLGRFTEDHRNIEHWVRVTHNDYANFFPDIWVEPGPHEAPHQSRRLKEHTPLGKVTWPSSTDNIVYLWKNGQAQNEIVLPAGERRILRPEPRGLARYAARHDMWLDNGYFVDEQAPALDTTFTIELMLESTEPSSTVQGLIVGYDIGFGIFEANGEWVFQYGADMIPLMRTVEDRPAHLLLSFSETHIHPYLNGVAKDPAELNSSVRSPKHARLYFGGLPELEMDWKGFLGHVALYARTMTPAEAQRNSRLAWAAYERATVAPSTTVRARVVGESSIPTPADIAPYTRGLLVNEYEIVEGDRSGERLLAAHWVILDGKVLDTARRAVDTEHTLELVAFGDRPELEGERVSMDNEDFTLHQYYDLNL